MKELEILLKELESKSIHFEVLNSKVSKSSVGWHIEHILLSINLIIKGLERSDPAAYRPKRSLAKFIVYTFNMIPRGRAKAPRSVRPADQISVELIQEHFTNAHASLKTLDALSKDHYFEHPYFGDVNLKSAIKFLNIHTKHHLKIIDDILKTVNN